MTARRLWLFTALIALALLASLLLSGGQLLRHLAGQTGAIALDLPPPPAQAEPAAPRQIGAIIALAPFGQPANTAPAAVESAAPLRLTLRGVLVDPDPAQSRAYVMHEGETGTFRLGEEIQQAELVAINRDTITLRRGEELVIVGFEGIEGEERPEAAPESPASPPTDPFARLAAAIVPGQGSIDLREAPPPETTEEYIDFWRERITRNPQSAMETVGVELVENGYRVTPDPNIGVTLAGLKPGDVVTRLNGRTLGNLERDRVLYDEVAAAGIARLEVVRAGKALLLTFPLR
jgi:general secretion pathway protein C